MNANVQNEPVASTSGVNHHGRADQNDAAVQMDAAVQPTSGQNGKSFSDRFCVLINELDLIEFFLLFFN